MCMFRSTPVPGRLKEGAGHGHGHHRRHRLHRGSYRAPPGRSTLRGQSLEARLLHVDGFRRNGAAAPHAPYAQRAYSVPAAEREGSHRSTRLQEHWKQLIVLVE